MAESSTATARLSCGTVERVVCEVWSGYFNREVSPYDNFFDLGGDSLAMIDVVGRARDRGLAVRASTGLRNPSPSRLAEALTVHAAGAEPVAVPALTAADPTDSPEWTVEDTAPEAVAPGEGAPLYAVHSDSHVQAERDSIASWGTAFPVAGVPLPGVRGPVPPAGSLDETADRVLAALPEQAEPYRLAGFGLGAVVAAEVARRLTAGGAVVELLVLVRPPSPEEFSGDPLPERVSALARRFGLSGAEDLEEIHARFRQDGWYDEGVRPADLLRLQRLWAGLALGARSWRPARHEGAAVLVHDLADPPEAVRAWAEALPGLRTHAFDHGIDSPMAVLRDERLADAMRRALES